MLVLLVIATCSDAVSNIKDEPVCVKIDDFSCLLTGVEQVGVIDLHSLVSDQPEPAFIIEAKSERDNESYQYTYNPCIAYNYNFCPYTSICQEGSTSIDAYDLGYPDTVKFVHENNSVFAFYKSKHKDYYRKNRSSEIELVCDETEEKGKFEYVGDPILRHYQFKLYTKCACLGKRAFSQTECKAKDLCSCEMLDGTGTINLHSLENGTYPLRDEASPTNTFLYSLIIIFYSNIQQISAFTALLGIAYTAQLKMKNNHNSIEFPK